MGRQMDVVEVDFRLEQAFLEDLPSAPANDLVHVSRQLVV